MNEKPLSKTVHNTPGITLEQFIALKPKELRLGQWFVNNYWGRFNDYSAWIYQLDGAKAKREIVRCMNEYQWSTLPEIVV